MKELTPGEQFEIEVNSVSHHVESTQPLTVAQVRNIVGIEWNRIKSQIVAIRDDNP